MYQLFFKRLIDFSISLSAFLSLFPLFFMVTVLLLIANKGNPFFLQIRPGKKGRLFKIIKFKTMNDGRDINGQLLTDAERLTPIGSFIRRTSLDELPQLLNVIKGEMSLIGPRPLLPEYLPLYSEKQYKRHNVRPGITGWAQVNGRNSISWEQKFDLDVWYVENLSFRLDLRIIVLTIKKVLDTDGINAEGHATISKFMGNNK